jgi:hypothetical protein
VNRQSLTFKLAMAATLQDGMPPLIELFPADLFIFDNFSDRSNFQSSVTVSPNLGFILS